MNNKKTLLYDFLFFFFVLVKERGSPNPLPLLYTCRQIDGGALGGLMQATL